MTAKEEAIEALEHPTTRNCPTFEKLTQAVLILRGALSRIRDMPEELDLTGRRFRSKRTPEVVYELTGNVSARVEVRGEKTRSTGAPSLEILIDPEMYDELPKHPEESDE